MDRFLDEQESTPQAPRDRSSSPSIHSLLYGDPKHQRPELKPTSDDIAAALQIVQKVVSNDPQFGPLKLMESGPSAESALPSEASGPMVEKAPSLKRPSSEPSDYSSPSKLHIKESDSSANNGHCSAAFASSTILRTDLCEHHQDKVTSADTSLTNDSFSSSSTLTEPIA
jgi:hypothetical protein